MGLVGIGKGQGGRRVWGGGVEWRIEALTGAFKKHKTNDRAPHSSQALSRGNKFAYLMYVPLRASLFICFISSAAAAAAAAWFSVFFVPSAKFSSTGLRVLASLLSVMSCLWHKILSGLSLHLYNIRCVSA